METPQVDVRAAGRLSLPPPSCLSTGRPGDEGLAVLLAVPPVSLSGCFLVSPVGCRVTRSGPGGSPATLRKEGAPSGLDPVPPCAGGCGLAGRRARLGSASLLCGQACHSFQRAHCLIQSRGSRAQSSHGTCHATRGVCHPAQRPGLTALWLSLCRATWAQSCPTGCSRSSRSCRPGHRSHGAFPRGLAH